MESPPKVLIVDDEPTLRFALGHALESEGYAVSTAADGSEAVAQVKEIPFDVVVMDIRMPKSDGLEALGNIRRAGATMPVILASSHGTPGKLVEAIRSGVSGFLSKPLQPSDIRLAVERVLARENDDGRVRIFERALHFISNGNLTAATEALVGPELDPQEQLLSCAVQEAQTNTIRCGQTLPQDVFQRLSYIA